MVDSELGFSVYVTWNTHSLSFLLPSSDLSKNSVVKHFRNSASYSYVDNASDVGLYKLSRCVGRAVLISGFSGEEPVSSIFPS